MPDIFDEVSEDLRAERTRQFLLRYAGLFVAAAFVVLLAVSVWQAWGWHEHRLEMRAAAQYLTLTQRIKSAGAGLTDAARDQDATALLDFAKTAPAGYATLARFRAAGLYADAGQAAKAEAIWTGIAAPKSGAAPLMRDVATLLWAQHAMGTMAPKTVMARLQPVMDPSNPMHDMAQMLGALTDLEDKQEKAARMLLARVSTDPQSPADLRNLANGLLAKLNG